MAKPVLDQIAAALAAGGMPKTQEQQAALDRLIALCESGRLPDAKPAEPPMANSIVQPSTPVLEPERPAIDDLSSLIGHPARRSPRRPRRRPARRRRW